MKKFIKLKQQNTVHFQFDSHSAFFFFVLFSLVNNLKDNHWVFLPSKIKEYNTYWRVAMEVCFKKCLFLLELQIKMNLSVTVFV